MNATIAASRETKMRILHEFKRALEPRLMSYCFTAVVALTMISGLGCRTTYGPATESRANSSSNQPSRSVRIPFELFGNNILVPVRLNGGEAALFIFDTGAAVTVVDEGWANKERLEMAGGVKLNAGGGTVEGKFARAVNIALPGLQSTNQSLAIVALDMLPPLFGRDIRGILGNTFIKDYVVEVDYARRALTFYRPEVFNLSQEARSLPMEMRGGIPFVQLSLSLGDASTLITGQFEIDSGSSGSLDINRPFAEQHRILDRVPKNLVEVGIGGAGVGGDMKSMNARIRGIQWGDHVLKNPIVSISQDEAGVGAGGDGGLLGGEVLRRFTMVLDYKSRRLLLTPNTSFEEPFDADLSGIELMTAPDDFKELRVKKVREGFPAAQAGLRAGDIIVSVNGKPAGDLNLDQWTKVLKRSGKRCAVVLRRGKETILTQFELQKRI